jgi:hypothetical protein
VDHPVLGLIAFVDREERVAALDALAAEADLDLARLPLERLVGPAVPDRHRPGAVAPLRDLPVEVEVLQRVVLGVDRQPVVLGLGRQAVGDGERDQHAVVLEPQVPVQARGVVLLDHEAPRRRVARVVAGRGLGRRGEVALAVVLLEAAGHRPAG